MNKREFLLNGCAGVAGTIGWVASSDASEGAAPPQGEFARLSGWQSRLGDEFALQTAPAGRLRLREVRNATGGPGHEQFTLVFESDGIQRARPAHTAILRHAGGRPVALYLEPLANPRASSAARYAAHFSLLT